MSPIKSFVKDLFGVVYVIRFLLKFLFRQVLVE